MGRKNSNATRRRKLDRRQKGMPRMPERKVVSRIAPEDIIMPDGMCYLNSRKPKARFETEEKARAALKQAREQRFRTGSGHVEKRVYRCPDIACPRCAEGTPKDQHRCPPTGCKGWHLTSRESFDDTVWKSRVANYGKPRS